jgi:geranylgeranyl pyrophosphate synthase
MLIDSSNGRTKLELTLKSLPHIQQGLDQVEKLMLAQAEDYHPDLKAALSVILSSGGKRIRPTIILLLGSLLNARNDLLITLATSIELLHTATLVHDDLIDGSILRRGIPTLNSKWSPAATVLTGDFVFACAAHMASKTNSNEVMRLFSQTLMTIVNGEVNQLFTSKCIASLEDYYRRIYAKTASLFETSTHATAIISQVDDCKTEILRKFGYELGMAFQIVDDVLDYTGNQSTVGKPVGGDLRQGLVTLPMLYYIEEHPEDQSVQALQQGHCIKSEDEVDRLVKLITESPVIQKSMDEAENFAARAQKYLLELPDSPERNSLQKINEFTISRRK